MKAVVPQVCVADYLMECAARLVLGTQPKSEYATPLAKKYVQYGASPRGLQALILGAKVQALLANRVHIAREDIQTVLTPSLQHRIILNFEGEADGITPLQIIQNLQGAVG
jgi:MoxR-like ATPase